MGNRGSVALRIVVSLTVGVPSSVVGDTWFSTTLVRLRIVASAMSRASSGLRLDTPISMMRESSGLEAEMVPASCSAVVSRPSSSMTGCSTTSDSASSTYVPTRLPM